MPTFARLRRLAACAAVALTLAPASALAATGGVRIIVQQWTPTNPGTQNDTIVLDRPGLIENALDQGWTLARDPVCNAIKTEAGKPDRLASGYTLYNIDCSMAKTGTVAIAGFANSILTLQYKLAGNTFKATTTQPSVAGKYADPCFFLSYDVTATTAFHLDTLAVDPFTVAISNVSRPDSCNTAGDIAGWLAKTYHFFGGPDYLALVASSLQRSQTISTAPLNAAMKSVVDPMQTYSKQYAARTNWIRNGNVYIAFAPVYVPQPLSAGISGTIGIPKGSLVSTAPDCSALTLSGKVQTGPAPIYDPVRMTTADPPYATVGISTAHGVAADAGGRFTCPYSETQIPAGVPVAYRGYGIPVAPINGQPMYRLILLPDGWSGNAALTTLTSGKDFVAVKYPSLDVRRDVRVDRAFVPDANPAAVTEAHVDPALGARINSLNAGSAVALNPQPLPPGGAVEMANGNRLFTQGDFAGAAAAFERALHANANNAAALHDLAVAHARLGQTAAAARELRDANALARANGDRATVNASATAIIIVGGELR